MKHCVGDVFAILVVLLLAAHAPAMAGAAQGSDDGRTSATPLQVLDAATLDVDVAGAADRIRLIGLDVSSEVGRGQATACLGESGAARLRQLVEHQPLQLQDDPQVGVRDAYGQRLAYVWLPDGRNVAEVLLREGLVRVTAGSAYAHQASFEQAEHAAAAEQLGIWAPGACATVEPSPELAGFVSSTFDQTQRAALALHVLREQALIAEHDASALTSAHWRETTQAMLGQLTVAGATLRSGEAPPDLEPQLAEQLALLGRDLTAEAEAYAGALNAGDNTRVAERAASLEAAGEDVRARMRELMVVAQVHRLGD